MHSNPCPSSLWHASRPLELVHTDVHQVPYPSFSGFRYWVSFIDDYSGIERQHTVRARPQQNGVAEQANRVLSEHLTTMLDESGLPKAFWGECLAALVHVWNRCPTEAVRSATPYELWHGRKPDVSHLQVWGCTAYVHVQKDKRPGLGSHMEKCVFIGYPQGYKGWKFYNPTTKKTVIAERADFDERYFPLSKRPSSASIAPPSPAVENTPAVTTLLPPSAPVENTPAATAPPRPRTLPATPKPASKSYYIPPHSDSDDESSSDSVSGSWGDIGPPALPAVVPVVPAPAPVPASPPPRSPSPVAPPRPPSPIGIGARLPRRTRMKPREWWKLSNAQLDDEVDDDIEDAEMGYEIALSTVSNAEPLSYAEALCRASSILATTMISI
jgi:hypothetical protein